MTFDHETPQTPVGDERWGQRLLEEPVSDHLDTSQSTSSAPSNNHASQEKHTPPGRQTTSPPIIRTWWWWWELGAVLLSIISMCLIAAVLFVLHGKPLADWNLGISPNAVISVLTTVGKASMMLPVAACISQFKRPYFRQPHNLRDLQAFDDASRGPWGALTLLLSTRGRTIGAALGAIITIVALGYEPSTQQILSYPSRSVNATNETATIMHAEEWQSKASSSTLLSINSPFSLAFEIAIFNGMMGTAADPAFNCPASECHFSDFTSLAICSTCEDISHAAKRSCSSAPVEPSRENSRALVFSCLYTPNDTFFSPVNITLADARFLNSSLPNYTAPFTIDFGDPTFAVQPTTGPAFGPYLHRFGFTAVNVTTNTTWANSEFTAGVATVHACTWTFCSQAYTDTTVLNGRLNYSVNFTLLDHNSTSSAQYISLDTNTSNTPTYRLDVYSILRIWSILESLFTAQITESSSYYSMNDIVLFFLWSSDLPMVADGISRALTNQIRGLDNLNSSYAVPSFVVPTLSECSDKESLIRSLC